MNREIVSTTAPSPNPFPMGAVGLCRRRRRLSAAMGKGSQRMRLRRGETKQKQQRAVAMRAQPTPAEATLWHHLRQLEARFSRQVVIRGFIVDFCCRRARLVVEVDGGVHDDQADADTAREAALRSAGYRVVRVTNDEVMADPVSIAARVASAASDPWDSGSPSP